MDPYYSYRSSAASAYAAASPYGGFSSPSYRLQPHSRDSYALDRWSSLPLPSSDLAPFSSISRSSLDPRLDRVSSFPRETLPPRTYARNLQEFRSRRGNARPSRKPQPAQSLRPKKKPFKQTQGAKATKPASGGKKATKNVESNVKSSHAENMAKETKELHSLWRTGIDTNPVTKPKVDEGQKGGKRDMRKMRKKRKRGSSKRRVLANEDGTSSEAKRSRRWTDEKQAIIDLQREIGHAAREYLGIPELLPKLSDKGEAEPKSEELKPEEPKPEEPTAEQPVTEEKAEESTSDVAKAVEEKSFEYFSKLLEENEEVRKLYSDKSTGGPFECLVCSGIPFMFRKRFRNLVSLVEHATQKRKKLPEHRGYGRALCSLMNWDIVNLPPVPKIRGTRSMGANEDGKDSEEKRDAAMEESLPDSKVENGHELEVPDKDTGGAPDEIEADKDDKSTEKDDTATEAANA